MSELHRSPRELTDTELDLVAGGQIFTSEALRDALAAERAARRAEMGGYQAGATVAESEANRARLIEQGLLPRT